MLERVQDGPAQTVALRASGAVVAQDVEAAINAAVGEAATGLVVIIVRILAATSRNWRAASQPPRWLTSRWSSSLSSSTRSRWTGPRSTVSRLRPSTFASSLAPTKAPRLSGRPRPGEGSSNASSLAQNDVHICLVLVSTVPSSCLTVAVSVRQLAGAGPPRPSDRRAGPCMCNSQALRSYSLRNKRHPSPKSVAAAASASSTKVGRLMITGWPCSYARYVKSIILAQPSRRAQV